jgi:ABC-type transport system involved in cytochrome bd biosynthesis fused ATPase/permease subunit
VCFRVLALGLALLVVSFLPASNLLFRVGFVLAERVLYIPSVGFCVLVTLGIRQLSTISPEYQYVTRLFSRLALYSKACSLDDKEQFYDALGHAGIKVVPKKSGVDH